MSSFLKHLKLSLILYSYSFRIDRLKKEKYNQPIYVEIVSRHSTTAFLCDNWTYLVSVRLLSGSFPNIRYWISFYRFIIFKPKLLEAYYYFFFLVATTVVTLWKLNNSREHHWYYAQCKCPFIPLLLHSTQPVPHVLTLLAHNLAGRGDT